MINADNGKQLRLPDFIHIGPGRTGTTWLQEALYGHVGLPSVKETLFFGIQHSFGIKWYSDFFKDYPPGVHCGEIAPAYFANAIARERIQEYIPHCKIICTLRDPATRLYSQFRLMHRGNWLKRSTDFDGYWHSLVHWGSDLCSYATQLRRWQEAFGSDRVLVLFYEDLMTDAQSYLDKLCDFIETPRVALKASPVGDVKVFSVWSKVRDNRASAFTISSLNWIAQHGGSSLIQRATQTRLARRVRFMMVEDYQPLSESSANDIRRLMLPETVELERMTGRDLSAWKPRGLSNGRPASEETHAHSS